MKNKIGWCKLENYHSAYGYSNQSIFDEYGNAI